MADPIDAYLDQLERSLDLPVVEQAAVREEITAHLQDERAGLIADGFEADAAAAEAVRRQGDPIALGQALTRARRTRRALFAAAGAGTIAAGGAAFRAWIIGIAGLFAILLAVGSVAAIATRGGTTGGWVIQDSGWYTAVGATTFWFGAWAAGRAFVAVAARESHRPAGQVRAWVAVLGGLVIAWLALVWLRVPQNWASVVVLALVPAWFVAAALTGSDRPIIRTRVARRAGLALFGTMAIGLPILALFGTTSVATLVGVGSGPYGSMQELQRALGLDLPGRLLVQQPDFGDEGWSAENGVASVTVGNAALITAHWHDLRIEAWRADLATGGLDRSSIRPIAAAPLSVAAGNSLVGSIRVDGVRDVWAYQIVLTGVAPDGQRDFLASVGGTNTSFKGSALDWLAAP